SSDCDVLHVQARIGDGAVRGLHQDFHFGEAGGETHAGMSYARNGGGASESFVYHYLASVGLKTTSLPSSLSMTWACTGMPMATASGARPSTRLIMRIPS